MMSSLQWTVFTKPWKMPLPELGAFVKGMGFDGVELPVRPGYPVEPDNVEKGLPEAARILGDHGVAIGTIAGPTDEKTIAACAVAGVPIIRICVKIDRDRSYLEQESELRSEYEAMVPVLDKHGVAIGVQNHCDFNVNNSMGIRSLIGDFDPKHFCAVLDQAHNGLNGEPPEFGIDIVWSHLRVVNLKSGYWQRTSGPEAEEATWKHYWTSGPQGLAYWPRVATELKKRGYEGNVCLTAEYSDRDAVDRLTVEDLAYAKSLFDW